MGSGSHLIAFRFNECFTSEVHETLPQLELFELNLLLDREVLLRIVDELARSSCRRSVWLPGPVTMGGV